MSGQITSILKRKLENLWAFGKVDAETSRNALKEELQFYVIDFIYHHPEYSKWVMYGGSALRIIHGLDRMSVDLDFEVSYEVTGKDLEELKKEIENHFINTYGAGADFLTIKITAGRGLTLKFHVGEELSAGNTSKQVHVKIDLNHFVPPKAVTERRPINHDQLSFVIITYNMAALMSSKLAAIFLRGTRGAGKAVYEEKGRDIYDLLWYMGKKAVPDFDYLTAKGIDVRDPRALFDKLTIKMNDVSDKNLEDDLKPLFVDKNYILNWLKNWRESFSRLRDDYNINTITEIDDITVNQDFSTDNYSFVFIYKTEEHKIVRIIYKISDYWFEFTDGDLPTKINDKIIPLVESNLNRQLSEKEKQYVTLFYEKTEAHLKKVNNIMLGNSISTKMIRMTADNFNRKEEIILNKSALLSCDLTDLLK